MKKIFDLSISILKNNDGFLGLAIAAIAGALLGGSAAAYNAHEQRKAAEKAAKIQQEANEKSEAIAAAKPQQETKQDSIVFNDDAKKSALRRTILSRSEKTSSKFGD